MYLQEIEKANGSGCLPLWCRQQLKYLQAEKGEFYELVITNPSCQYRYRIGDVVKVVGYHNQCPIIEFMYR